jgi:hypothetical protein
MSDDQIKISAELLKNLEPGISQAFKENKDEFNRSIETSTGFFEKLFALDAALMGLVATVIMAIMARSEYPTYQLREALQRLVIIFNLLGFSLIFAVIHHFLAVQIASDDAEYANTNLIGALVKEVLLDDPSNTHEVVATQSKVVVGMVHQKLVTEPQKKIVKTKHSKHRCMKIIGYISIGLFLLAYIFVAICSWQIWYLAI